MGTKCSLKCEFSDYSGLNHCAQPHPSTSIPQGSGMCEAAAWGSLCAPNESNLTCSATGELLQWAETQGAS